jgi:phosphatidylglycerophosphate synthase
MSTFLFWIRWGISLFAYQSLDAIDGKQARRTGMAGPLGEMFDHGTYRSILIFLLLKYYFAGCDALNTTVSSVKSENKLL